MSSHPTTKSEIQATDAFDAKPEPGKDELNFAQYPMTLMTNKQPATNKLVWQGTAFDPNSKTQIPWKVVVTGSEEHGLPVASDNLVLLGLIQISKADNFANRKIEFTQAKMLELLGWSSTGQNRKRLKDSLFCLGNTNYLFDKAWWSAKDKQWTTHSFSLIDSVEILESGPKNSKKQSTLYRIYWNQAVYESFENGFLRSINFGLCKQLSSIGLALYRFTQKNFHHSPVLCLNLVEFIRNGLGLLGQYDGIAHHIRAIEPAIQELEKAGELEPLKKTERFFQDKTTWMLRLVKTGHGHWNQKQSPQPKKVSSLPDPIPLPLFNEPAFSAVQPTVVIDVKAKEQPTPKSSPSQQIPTPPQAAPLPAIAGELMARGVSESVARQLAAQNEEAYLRQKIDELQFLIETNQAPSNPGAFLATSIRGRYTAPPGYISQAERERRAEEKTAVLSQAEQETQQRRDTQRLMAQVDYLVQELRNQPERYEQERRLAVLGLEEDMSNGTYTEEEMEGMRLMWDYTQAGALRGRLLKRIETEGFDTVRKALGLNQGASKPRASEAEKPKPTSSPGAEPVGGVLGRLFDSPPSPTRRRARRTTSV